jgi:hypothetical protein
MAPAKTVSTCLTDAELNCSMTVIGLPDEVHLARPSGLNILMIAELKNTLLHRIGEQ